MNVRRVLRPLLHEVIFSHGRDGCSGIVQLEIAAQMLVKHANKIRLGTHGASLPA
ncbi:MAG: hypothetical protein ACXWNL_03965 [Vulcanimicrobiaceae bacterium]